MRFIVCTLLALLSTSDLRAAAGISPYFAQDAVPAPIVGLRYSMRLDYVKPGENVVLVFGHMRFLNDAVSRKTHMLEVNAYNYWVEYKDTGSVPWPPARNGTAHHNQGALWVSVPDYNREGFVGIQQQDEETFKLFPRMNSGIDNIPGLTKIEMIGQQDMLGKDIYIEVTQGKVVQFDSPQENWGGRYRLQAGKQVSEEKLPAGRYRLWNMKAVFDGKEYRWVAALPADQAEYFAPFQIIHFVTEFFEMKSKMRVYLWNPQFLSQGQKDWEGLSRWKYHHYAGPDPYGPRVDEVDGRHVLELSNDKKTESYLKKDDIFDLKMNPTVQ